MRCLFCCPLLLSLPRGQTCDLDDLVKHALKALSGCVTGDKELDAQGLTLAIVGKVSKLVAHQFHQAIHTKLPGRPPTARRVL